MTKHSFSNEPPPEAQQAFVEAGKDGKIDVIRELFSLFDDKLIEVRDSGGDTALTWAAYNDHREVVEFLLEKGANVNAPGMHEKSALIWAIERSHKEITLTLLEHGASLYQRDKSGLDAMEAARRSFDGEMLDLITEWQEKKKRAAAEIKKEEDTKALSAARLKELKKHRVPKL